MRIAALHGSLLDCGAATPASSQLLKHYTYSVSLCVPTYSHLSNTRQYCRVYISSHILIVFRYSLLASLVSLVVAIVVAIVIAISVNSGCYNGNQSLLY